MEQIKLNELAGGKLQENFDEALKKVINNLLDENTSTKTSRDITITIKASTDDCREDITLDMNIKTKLAPIKAVKTVLAVEKSGDELYVGEYNATIPGQMDIGDYLNEEVDEETGEITNAVEVRKAVTQ